MGKLSAYARPRSESESTKRVKKRALVRASKPVSCVRSVRARQTVVLNLNS